MLGVQKCETDRNAQHQHHAVILRRQSVELVDDQALNGPQPILKCAHHNRLIPCGVQQSLKECVLFPTLKFWSGNPGRTKFYGIAITNVSKTSACVDFNDCGLLHPRPGSSSLFAQMTAIQSTSCLPLFCRGKGSPSLPRSDRSHV